MTVFPAEDLNNPYNNAWANSAEGGYTINHTSALASLFLEGRFFGGVFGGFVVDFSSFSFLLCFWWLSLSFVQPCLFFFKRIEVPCNS